MIGERIRELRQSRGISLDQLAAATDIDKSDLSRYENGKRYPAGVVISRLAPALGVPEGELALTTLASRLVDVARDLAGYARNMNPENGKH